MIPENSGLHVVTDNESKYDSQENLYDYVNVDNHRSTGNSNNRSRSQTIGSYGLRLGQSVGPWTQSVEPSAANYYPSADHPSLNQPQPNMGLNSNHGDSSSIESFQGGREKVHNVNSIEDKTYKRWSRMFLIISVISAILIIVLEAYVYAVINIHKTDITSNSKYQEVSIFLALFIFAAIFQVIITIIGLQSNNILLLLMLCGFYGCMLIYTGIQYQEIRQVVGDILEEGWNTATRATNVATICVLAATFVLQLYIILGHLNKYVKWSNFKTIGADTDLKRNYQIFQIHRSLLMFGFFFFLGFTIQFIIIMINDKSSVEFILTIIVLPVTIILLMVSDIGISNEYYWVAVPSLVIYFGGIAYVLFKMIRLYTQYTSAYNVTLQPGDYFPGRSSLITFGVITLVILVAIIVVEIILMINFNRGLKPIVKNPHYLIFKCMFGKTQRDNDFSEKLDDEFSID